MFCFFDQKDGVLAKSRLFVSYQLFALSQNLALSTIALNIQINTSTMYAIVVAQKGILAESVNEV